MPIVSRIQSLAKAHNKTLSGIERILGFGNGSIRKWNVNHPSSDKLEKVADYFGISVDYLLGRTENPAPLQPSHANATQSAFDDLSEDEHEALLKYLINYRAQRSERIIESPSEQ